MTVPVIGLEQRFWRMLTIRWQRDPLSGAGAERHGGRWNRVGQPTLYFSADHATAVAEFHQDVVRPGTLAAYDLHGEAIIDLTDAAVRQLLGIADTDLTANWETIVALRRGEPPGWRIADRVIAGGAHGALVPSAVHAGGTNLVLWRWSTDGGPGASVRLIDPHGDLIG